MYVMLCMVHVLITQVFQMLTMLCIDVHTLQLHLQTKYFFIAED